MTPPLIRPLPKRKLGAVDLLPFRVPKRRGVIRVGAYYPSMYVGGAEVWIRTLLRNLPRGFEAVGVGVDEVGRLPPLATHGVRVTRNIESLLASSDVLLAWGVASLREVRRSFGGPIVYLSQHGDAVSRDTGRRLAPAATHHAAISEYCRKAMPPAYYERTVIIDNGVEPAPVMPRDEAKRRLGLAGKLTVGFVGRWADDKDPLAAARAVAELGPDAVAVYHGYNSWTALDYPTEVRKIVGRRCLFRTPKQDVNETWSALDCFIHVPDEEGFGLVFLEAWNARTAVVASSVGIVAECGCADRVVTLVPPRADGPTLAAAVRQAVEGQTVEPAYRLFRERYTAEVMGRNWGRYFAAAVGRRR